MTIHERAPVYQGLLSVSFSILLRLHVSIFLACFSSLPSLTRGRFDSSLCLCLCLSLCLCLCPAGSGRAGQSPRRDSQALCLTSSGLPCVFVSCSHLVLCVIAHTSRQFSVFTSDGEAPNGGSGATRRLQADAIAASSASCGLTTIAGTSERFRRGFTTIANTSSSRAA